jgi:LacI family transcriptional regulator
MVTLDDIALKTGVSRSSVGSVLRGDAEKRRIAPATCERVRQVAAELGYHHNALAKALSTGKSGIIGIIGRSYPDVHHAMSVEAAARSLVASGLGVSLQDLSWRGDDETAQLKQLLTLRADGLIIEAGGSPELVAMLQDLVKRGFPIVRQDVPIQLATDYVKIDREIGAYTATRHLLELGHTRIAFAIDKNSPSSRLRDRLRGYRRAHKEAGIAVNETIVTSTEMSATSTGHDIGYYTTRQILKVRPRVTALLTVNDQVAMGALRATFEAGVRVPDDLAMVGFMGIPEGEHAIVPLTTVAFPFEEMGRTAAAMLQERLNGSKRAPHVVTLAPELLVRRSCGAHAGKAECNKKRYERGNRI